MQHPTLKKHSLYMYIDNYNVWRSASLFLSGYPLTFYNNTLLCINALLHIHNKLLIHAVQKNDILHCQILNVRGLQALGSIEYWRDMQYHTWMFFFTLLRCHQSDYFNLKKTSCANIFTLKLKHLQIDKITTVLIVKLYDENGNSLWSLT